MPDTDVRDPIRRANRTTPLWIGIAVLAVIVGLVVRDGDDERRVAGDRPGTTTTPADEDVVVHGIAAGALGPVAASSASDELASGDAAADFEALQAPVVSTGGWVVALVDGGTLLAGRVGEAMSPVGPATPVTATPWSAPSRSRTPRASPTATSGSTAPRSASRSRSTPARVALRSVA